MAKNLSTDRCVTLPSSIPESLTAAVSALANTAGSTVSLLNELSSTMPGSLSLTSTGVDFTLVPSYRYSSTFSRFFGSMARTASDGPATEMLR
ncbi:Uncharacterised protein [Mycobacteroides abscessus subsp. abscessus]|nr:Uncharacterised protein [Mycobacteroides abscessus subsp. abscessus]